MRDALAASGLPADAVQALSSDRAELAAMIADPSSADVVIPRGGEQLKHFLLDNSRIPVLAAAGGNCHVYVDASADEAKAIAIAVNAKVQRPGVCNAAETLLVHRDRADLVPALVEALEAEGVEVLEGEEAWATEFLDLKIALRVVDDLDQALDHIARYGTGHSEAIVTEDDAGGGTIHARGRRRGGVRERLHPLYRRRRLWHGRRDRHLNQPPACSRTTRAGGADDHEVCRDRRRADETLTSSATAAAQPAGDVYRPTPR